MNEPNIASNIVRVEQRLRAAEQRYGRTVGSVRLLPVSKTKPVTAINEAIDAGYRAFGENYAQEAVDKADALQAQALEWHFIGPVQSNKTRPLAACMAWVHTIDREKIARRLSEQRPTDLPALQICLQVNVSGEASKSGLRPDEVAALADVVAGLPRLALRGLMTIPAIQHDHDAQRRSFAQLYELQQKLKCDHPQLDTLSMGMSGDLEAAVQEGATLVRVGTDIFGAR